MLAEDERPAMPGSPVTGPTCQPDPTSHYSHPGDGLMFVRGAAARSAHQAEEDRVDDLFEGVGRGRLTAPGPAQS